MLTRTLLPVVLALIAIPAIANAGIPANPPSDPSLIPLPVKVEWKKDSCQLGTVIGTDGKCDAEGKLLAEMLHPATGIAFDTTRLDVACASPASIRLSVDASLASKGKEAYHLSVTPTGIEIKGASPAGVFYGIETLRQLLPVENFAEEKQTGVEWKVPGCEIDDAPRFAWRGFMLDDSRHFLGPVYVKRLIDLMAMHKLNLLHWHLSDDDGFRIEIKSYPKLTDVGAWRGTECKLPNTRPGENHANYGGFYTQDEIRKIVAYAAARHIDIMPEIDIPGHSGAAAVAYPEILCEGKTQGNVWCVGREDNYKMLDAMVDELAKLFPFPYIHIGGDEVDHKAWDGCPRCKALMEREHITSLAHIQRYLTARYEGILKKHGRQMIGWNEILDDKLAKSTAVMAWQNDVPGYKAATGGWNVVFAPGQHCYLDMKESPRDTWGMSWAGIVPLTAVYNYDPLARPGLTDEQKKRVLGVEACLWTEFITSNDRGDYKIWPRLCALAEMGWTPQAGRDYAGFMNRLGPAHLERLGLLGVKYRVPDPEVKLAAKSLVQVQTPFKDADVHYTTDGSEPTESSPRRTDDFILVRDPTSISAKTFMPGGRTSHTVKAQETKK